MLHKSYRDDIAEKVTTDDEEAYSTLMDIVQRDFGVLGADDMDEGQ